MTKGVLLCGVDDQGTILASRLIALAAMKKGIEARGAKAIDMAQGGGNVVSHVHIGEEVYSPLMPHDKADVIIGFEPAEAVRRLPYLRRGGCVAVSPAPIRPVTASLTGDAYAGRKMMGYLEHTRENLVMVGAASIDMECSSPKVASVALLGTAIASRLIGISLEEMEAAIEKRMPEKFKDMNMKTLKLGVAASAIMR